MQNSNQLKAAIILRATQFLDPAEAAAAEAKVLGRAGRLTPPSLRAAIARAVMQVAPGKARTRREQAARDARVERWAEDSGNAALMGRELPPAEVLAADQRITAWARELKQAGLDGDMDVLRARAYLDLLLGKDSRPGQDAAGGDDGAGHDDTGPDGPGGGAGPGGPAGPAGRGQPDTSPAGPAAGAVPAGFAGRVNLTVPAATVTGRADRPGEIAGIGPVDPDPGANTSNRYQNGHQPNPALGRISVPDRCPRTAVAGGGHARCHAAGNLLRDDRQMRAARLPSCLI